MSARSLSLALLALTAMPAMPADFVFGRRVYAAEGRTYQQIWTLDARTKKIAPLTSSERRHAEPVCSPDGKRIWFLSGPFGDEVNNEIWWFDPQTRTEQRALLFTGRLAHLVGGSATAAFFTAYNDDHPALYRWDGRLTKLAPVGGSVLTAAALSPDTRTLAVQTGDAPTVTMMEAGGARGRILKDCAAPAWSPDGRRIACAAGRRIRVIDLATDVEVFHADFLERPTEPAVAAFSPDGKRLLIRTAGANENSTFPQSDYWELELAGTKWTFVGPG